MKLSIVILHHNTPENVIACLKSIQNSNLPELTEVLVLDNGGKQSNKAIKTSLYPAVQITLEDIPNNGFPAGQNYGAHNTTGEYIAVINPDIVLEPNCLQLLITHLEQQSDCGIATAELQYEDGRIQDHTRKFPSLWSMVTRRLFGTSEVALPFNNNEDHRPIDWCTGALWLIRRSALEAIGGHDERYFLFMSDIGLSREMWTHGYTVHQVRGANAEHGSERLSGGNILTMVRKKTGRIHIKDALTYFKHYLGTPYPHGCPSNN